MPPSPRYMQPRWPYLPLISGSSDCRGAPSSGGRKACRTLWKRVHDARRIDGRGSLCFRMVSGAGDERGFTSGQVSLWLPAIAVMLALLALVAWRLNIIRRRAVGHSRVLGPRARTEQRRHLPAKAERLAGTASARQGPAASNAVLQDWSSRLEQLERRGITPATIAQTRQMEPSVWLVWVFYNGDMDVSRVIAR